MGKHILVVVDMQNDFIDGSLGTAEAVAIVPAVTDKIAQYSADPDAVIYATLDTHPENYMETAEGKKLPVPHCVKGTEGHRIAPAILEALEAAGCTYIEKPTFGSLQLLETIQALAADTQIDSFELCGLCTDICVVSNTLLLKAAFPELPFTVDAACCAGVTPQTHAAALTTMSMCQIDIGNQ